LALFYLFVLGVLLSLIADLSPPAVPAQAGGPPPRSLLSYILRLSLPFFDVIPVSREGAIPSFLAQRAAGHPPGRDPAARDWSALIRVAFPLPAVSLAEEERESEWQLLPSVPLDPRPAAVSRLTGKAPLVLVYHTHSSESYLPAMREVGERGERPYSRDPRVNMLRVGEELVSSLQAEGIPAFHLRVEFDRQGLTGSYVESERGVREVLSRYPTIRYLIDVHRNSAPRSQTVVEVEGRPVARVMFVVGKGSPALPNPHWKENEAFGRRLAEIMEAQASNLVRYVSSGGGGWTYVRSSRFNQHLSPRAILVEVGGPENTLPEALEAARLLGRALARLVREEGGEKVN